MNRLVQLLIIYLIISAVPCVGQTRKNRSKPKKPPAERTELIAILDEHFPEAWRPFTSNQGRFSVLFPGQPKDISQVQTEGQVKLITHRFQFVSPNATYEARFLDLPYQLDSPEGSKGILDAVRADLLVGAKGQPLSESDATLAGNEAKYIVWQTEKGMLLKAKYFLIGNRVYWLLFAIPQESNLPDEIQHFRDSIAARFFDSFIMFPRSPGK